MAAGVRKALVTLTQGAFVVSLLALVVSGLVGLSQWQVSKRLAAIEEARRSDEVSAAKRARIVARIDHEQSSRGTHLNHFVVLKNDGAAPAKNVTIEAVLNRLEFFGVESPIPVLGAGQEFRFQVVAFVDGDPTFSLTVTWEDDLGPSSSEFTLNLY